MTISLTARERRAVSRHSCPKCGAQRGFRCRQVGTSGRVKLVHLGHPHKERVELVEEDS
jgi:hypothetical protein